MLVQLLNQSAEPSRSYVISFQCPDRIGVVAVSTGLFHEVTASDIQLAARENFISVEHVKRYTTNGRIIEIDMGEKLLAELGAKEGMKLSPVNPRNWTHGSFESIHIRGKTAYACGDPHRTAQAMAV